MNQSERIQNLLRGQPPYNILATVITGYDLSKLLRGASHRETPPTPLAIPHSHRATRRPPDLVAVGSEKSSIHTLGRQARRQIRARRRHEQQQQPQ